MRLEVGHPGRQAPEIVVGPVWGLFNQDDSVLLVITFSDSRQAKPEQVHKAELVEYDRRMKENAGKQDAQRIVPPDSQFLIRDWCFSWVNIDNIMSLTSDAHARVNLSTWGFSRPKVDALYAGHPQYHPYHPGFHLINNALSRQINAKLTELGFESEYKGVYVDANNNRITMEQAAFPTMPVSPVQAAPVPVPEPAVVVPPSQQVSVEAPVATL
ncbi:MAG: hypothetical protein GZ088_16080 [Acidipila sp.]|nr:hypothetical protein [Acidipila sp.]